MHQLRCCCAVALLRYGYCLHALTGAHLLEPLLGFQAPVYRL